MLKKNSSIILFFLFVFLYSNLQGGQSFSLNDAMNNGPGRYKLENAKIEIEKMPGSENEFLELRQKIGNNPMGGYALFVLSMIKYASDKEMGLKFFVISLDKSNLIKSDKKGSYQGYYPHGSIMYHIKRMNSIPYLGNVLVQNTDYKNGYNLPSFPWTIKFNQLTFRNQNDVSMYAFTTSGNMPRPLTLRKNNRGYWKVTNVSSLFVGVSRLPAKKVDDDI